MGESAVGVNRDTYLGGRRFVGRALAERYLGVTFDGFDELVRLGEVKLAGRYRVVDLERAAAAIAAVRAGAGAPVKIAAKYQPQHLYLLELVGQCVKVGITAHPERRLATHYAAARSHGREVGRAWVSVSHAEAFANERVLKGDSSSEYLKRRFSNVLQSALALPMTAVEAARD